MVLVIFKNAVQKYLQNSILLKPNTGQIKKNVYGIPIVGNLRENFIFPRGQWTNNVRRQYAASCDSLAVS